MPGHAEGADTRVNFDAFKAATDENHTLKVRRRAGWAAAPQRVLRVAVRPSPFGVVLLLAQVPAVVPRVRPAIGAFPVPRASSPAAVPVRHLIFLALYTAFCARLRRGRACQEQWEEAHGSMALRRVWGCPSGAMCFRGTRTCARRTICVLCLPFAWQTVCEQQALVSLCALAHRLLLEENLQP